MQKILKKIFPSKVLHLYRKIRTNKIKNRFSNKTVDEVFTEIYKTNFWGSDESISGTGSDHAQTANVVKMINLLLEKKVIKTILDLPCGDFNWMQRINLTDISYIGADIVEDLILKNKRSFSHEDNINFVKLDLISDPLPKSDILINRDCLIHFSYESIYNAIKNIKSSGCKYLLSTTYTNHIKNHDIVTGDWRAINLEKSPFNFPKPIIIINENSKERDGEFNDKSLALWLVSDIKLPSTVYK